MEIIGLVLLLVVLFIMAASSGGNNPLSSNAPAPPHPAPGYALPAHYSSAFAENAYRTHPEKTGFSALPVGMFLICLASFVYYYRVLNGKTPGQQQNNPLPEQQQSVRDLVPASEALVQNREITIPPKPQGYTLTSDEGGKILRVSEPVNDDRPQKKVEFRRRTEMHALKLGVYSSAEGVELLKEQFPRHKIEALLLADGEYWACILFNAPAELRDELDSWKARRRQWVACGIEPEPVNLHHICTKILQEKKSGLCISVY